MLPFESKGNLQTVPDIEKSLERKESLLKCVYMLILFDVAIKKKCFDLLQRNLHWRGILCAKLNLTLAS